MPSAGEALTRTFRLRTAHGVCLLYALVSGLNRRAEFSSKFGFELWADSGGRVKN